MTSAARFGKSGGDDFFITLEYARENLEAFRRLQRSEFPCFLVNDEELRLNAELLPGTPHTSSEIAH